MNEFSEGRLAIVDYIKKELIGPANGIQEELDGEPPHKRYTMGILFPVESSIDKETEGEEEEVVGNSTYEEMVDDPVTLSGQWMPSSMGLSFYFRGEPTLNVQLYGAKYIKTKEGRSLWTRQVLADDENPEIIKIAPENLRCNVEVLNGNGRIIGHWRQLGDGYLVTVTLVNANKKISTDVNGEDCLCQVGFDCFPLLGEIQEYPSVKVSTTDPEEQELQLLYRRNKVFAVGHGCSVEWNTDQECPSSLRTQVLPNAYVQGMTHDLDESPEILEISRLAGKLPKEEVIDGLKGFVKLYEKWIDNIETNNQDIPLRLSEAKGRLLDRLKISLSRMNEGILCLSSNSLAWESFQLSNLAMLIQMKHSTSEFAGDKKKRNRNNLRQIDYLDSQNKWRPFQLAFQLLVVESIVNADSEFREEVDLIWFPTGGGKTEAYLTIAAFEIIYRRLKYKDKGEGTAVITRYTLRLLTSQQFQRSSRLITACEFLRRKYPDKLGSSPITIGFWAGKDTSPNDYKTASEKLGKIKESTAPITENVFQIDSCPWCGTELLPERSSEDDKDFGFNCTNISFSVYCPSDNCPFHDSIPVSVIDEDLYRNPPSFLIATVDKFARMAWVEGARSFFGRGNQLPPSLVIQDELHLLSGPLGTTVGLYESAFEGLMSFHNAKPKIIASTATIRSSGQQIQSLFGRTVNLFPSSGLRANDSFFAKTDTKKPGRLYLGVMSSNHRATTSVVRTAAALLQSIEEIEDLTDEEKDAYWTLVIYHLSLRELGKTVSFARDDIPARIKVIASTEDHEREIFDEDVLELTSNLNAWDIPDSLQRMGKSFKEPNSVSILACTNMLSVGIDVPRLGLMMVNGQPKTTSEYIQASSRVGRGKIPGLVVTHYSASKPRDRSHYESFLAYHSSLYRFVEPASVTPFSLPSRNRALHAALVILIRHGAGLSSNADAKLFDPLSPEIQKAIKILIEQAKLKDPLEGDNSEVHIRRLVNEWAEKVKESNQSGYPLEYQSWGHQVKRLLKDFGATGEGWPTLHTMRSVDPECEITVLGE